MNLFRFLENSSRKYPEKTALVCEKKRITYSQLKERAEISPKKPGSRPVTSKQFERNPWVSAYVKKRANGECQLCEKEAPFKTKEGEPFLETHHIKWLADGGEDSIENTVALCPNCHRKMHSLNIIVDKEKLLLKAKG